MHLKIKKVVWYIQCTGPGYIAKFSVPMQLQKIPRFVCNFHSGPGKGRVPFTPLLFLCFESKV